RGELRALDPDVEVDDAVVGDIDLAVVVEVPVEPPVHAEGNVEIDPAVIGDVDLAVQVCIPSIGVHDERVGAGHGLSSEDGGIGRVGQPLRLLSGGDTDGVEDAGGGGGLGGDDAV